MTSKFDQQDLQKLVSESLDTANDNLTDAQLSDIAQARMNAIRQAKRQLENSKTTRSKKLTRVLGLDWLLQHYQLSGTLAVAVVIAVLVSYNQENQVPAIPLALFDNDMPTEELAMLEDLEFANWLAEKEQEGLL